jgi:acyl carrier protein phosphodiesterase
MSGKNIILVMNFLAHLYLSGNHPKRMVGNFIGDFVKGKDYRENFEKDIAIGIELHRVIDEFTDNHPIVTKSKERLRPKYRHYSPVVVDMFYDHFLAANWNDYDDRPLPLFAREAYGVLEQYHAILPSQVQRMLPYMTKGNWLVGYAAKEGIHRALSGMAARTPFHSRMEEAINELELFYSEFENEFTLFFPDIKRYCDNFLIS